MRAPIKMPLFYLSTQEFPLTSKNKVKKQNPVFSHRDNAPKKKEKAVSQLYSRYMSHRDISLSSTNTSAHHKKAVQKESTTKLKGDLVSEQNPKAKLSTSINEVDQYYLDIIYQKNKEIKQLKEEIEDMKQQTTKKTEKREISFETKRQAAEEKSNRNSVRELFNRNIELKKPSKSITKYERTVSYNKPISKNCLTFKPIKSSSQGMQLKKSLSVLKTRAFNVMTKLSRQCYNNP